MKRVILLVVCVLMTGTAVIPLAGASKEEADIYFNAGTEKYLQGNFTESIENLEKAQALNPQNAKIKEFMVKILLEAATQNNLNRNYRQAFTYLKKAQTIAPDNPKVQEMYQLTRDLLTPTEEKVAEKPKAKEKAAGPAPVAPSSATVEAAAVPARKEQRTAAAPATHRTLPAPVVVTIPQVRREFAESRHAATDNGRTALWLGLSWFFVSCILIIILANRLFVQSKRLEEDHRTIEGQAKDITRLFEEKSMFLTELERTKESLRYEHIMAENFRKELGDLRMKEEERTRQEREQRQAAEPIRKIAGELLRRDEERLVQYVNDSTKKDDGSASVVESTRERIALMAQSMYEDAPGVAIDFLRKMSKDQNPLIRSNIVMALGRIASAETVEILIGLASDVDERVKREVLKYGKLVQEKIDAGMLKLDPAVTDELGVLLSKERTRGEWIF